LYSLELSRRINRIQFDIVYGDEFFYRQQKPRFDRRVTRVRGETFHIDEYSRKCDWGDHSAGRKQSPKLRQCTGPGRDLSGVRSYSARLHLSAVC